MIVPKVEVFNTNEYSVTTANQIGEMILAQLKKQGGCRIGLAGGGTPKPIYQHLAGNVWEPKIRWEQVELLWGDERCVPPDHPQSNYQMAKAALIDRVQIPAQNSHRMRGEDVPATAAKDYESFLDSAPIDILLLGMGGDGHTASLFPGSSALKERDRRVVDARSPVAPHQRISLTVRAINESQSDCLLVTGREKAARIAEVLREIESNHPHVPAAFVHPQSGRLVWFVDENAATELPSA